MFQTMDSQNFAAMNSQNDTILFRQIWIKKRSNLGVKLTK